MPSVQVEATVAAMIRAIENDASLSSADKKRMIADLRRTALAIRATVGDKAGAAREVSLTIAKLKTFGQSFDPRS